MNTFEFPTQYPRQVGRLVPHGILVDRREFLEGLDGQVFREILDHPENSIIEGSVDLARVLDVMDHVLNTRGQFINIRSGAPHSSAAPTVIRRWRLLG